jgi:copper resistance protein B
MTQNLRAALAAAVITLVPLSTAWAQEKGSVFYAVQMEELEYRYGESSTELLVWDGDAFVGTDELKLRWLGSGEYDLDAEVFETLENRIVLQTPISTFFDVKGGFRFDTPDGPDRWYGLVGVTGLAPQWFEVDADLFLSEEGDASFRIDVEYELLITNYLILTPSAELDIAFSDDEEMGVGRGVSSAEIGLRLSYDLIDRSLSPYVGVAYEHEFGRTADFSRDEGEATETWFAVVGAKLRF